MVYLYEHWSGSLVVACHRLISQSKEQTEFLKTKTNRINRQYALGRGPRQKNGKILTELSFFAVFNHKNDLEKVWKSRNEFKLLGFKVEKNGPCPSGQFKTQTGLILKDRLQKKMSVLTFTFSGHRSVPHCIKGASISINFRDTSYFFFRLSWMIKWARRSLQCWWGRGLASSAARGKSLNAVPRKSKSSLF